jgi:hypothetical protein
MIALVQKGVIIPDADIRSPDQGRYTAAYIASLSREEKAALPVVWRGERFNGVWEVVADPVPDGMKASGWQYEVAGDHVRAVPLLTPEPLTVDVLAEVIKTFPGVVARNGDELTPGRFYPAGTTVGEGFTLDADYWHLGGEVPEMKLRAG